MYELVWGEPVTFLEKRRVRRNENTPLKFRFCLALHRISLYLYTCLLPHSTARCRCTTSKMNPNEPVVRFIQMQTASDARGAAGDLSPHRGNRLTPTRTHVHTQASPAPPRPASALVARLRGSGSKGGACCHGRPAPSPGRPTACWWRSSRGAPSPPRAATRRPARAATQRGHRLWPEAAAQR